MSDVNLPTIEMDTYPEWTRTGPDPVLPYRWRPMPWLLGGALLMTLQLALGADPIYAALIFAFVLLTGATMAALDGITTVVGCCVGFLAFEHVLFCQTLKVLLWQRPDSAFLRPIETAGVYVVGMASLLAGAMIWRVVRPTRWKPIFRRELDPRRLLWMTGFGFSIGAVRFILARTGSQMVGVNAADVFEPISLATGTAYTILVSRGTRSLSWVNALPMLLSFVTSAIGTSRLNLLTGPVIYYLTCYAFHFRFRTIHLVVLLASIYIAQFILFPYALYARDQTRTQNLDTNLARASDLLIAVMMDPAKYQELMYKDANVSPEMKRFRYFGAHGSTLDRFAVMLSADAIIDATLTRGTLGMKLITPGFTTLLPHYLAPVRDNIGTSNALAHRAKGLVNKYDPTTQITLGFFCDAFSSFSWTGVAVIPALILLGYCFAYQLLFDRTLWSNVLAVAVVKNTAWAFSESVIAPQIADIIQGFIILFIVLWAIRGLVNQTQNYHEARLRARRARGRSPIGSSPA